MSSSPKTPSPASAEPAAPSRAERTARLFQRYPLSGTHVTRSGAVVSTPFHCYDADALILYGTADLAALESLTQGTGYFPVSTDTDPGRRGFVRLWLMDYQDTILGPYHEWVISIDADRHPRAIPWKNAFSAMVPSADPDHHGLIDRLLLDQPLACEYGRELLGLDKRPGRFAIQRERSRVRFEVTDAEGLLVARGDLATARGPRAALRSLYGIAAALGPAGTLRMLTSAVLMEDAVTRDVLSGPGDARLKLLRVVLASTPALRPVDGDDRLEFGPKSELGCRLGALDFRPMIVYHDPHLQFVMDTLPTG